MNDYKQKTWVLTPACSTFVAYHSHNGKQTEKHPRLEYIDTRKVCEEATRASRTLRRAYTTLRGSYP